MQAEQSHVVCERAGREAGVTRAMLEADHGLSTELAVGMSVPVAASETHKACRCSVGEHLRGTA